MRKLLSLILALLFASGLTAQVKMGGTAKVGGTVKTATQAAGGPVDFVNDTFTDTDGTVLSSHTGEVGATWTLHTTATGLTSVLSNNLYKDNTANAAVYWASGTPASTAYTVEAGMIDKAAVGRSSRACGWMDTTVVTAVCVGRPNSTSVELGKFINGTFTQLDTAAVTFATDQVRVLKVTRSGTDYEWWLDGVSQGVTSITDSELSAAGRVAVRQTGAWVAGGADAYPITYIKAYQ